MTWPSLVLCWLLGIGADVKQEDRVRDPSPDQDERGPIPTDQDVFDHDDIRLEQTVCSVLKSYL